MKKLSLKKLNLEISDLLKREHLKTVFGGYVASCSADCGGGRTVTCSGSGTCTSVDGASGYCTLNGETTYC